MAYRGLSSRDTKKQIAGAQPYAKVPEPAVPSRDTVRSRVSRARAAMRQELSSTASLSLVAGPPRRSRANKNYSGLLGAGGSLGAHFLACSSPQLVKASMT
jgi:hypothetical protein